MNEADAKRHAAGHKDQRIAATKFGHHVHCDTLFLKEGKEGTLEEHPTETKIKPSFSRIPKLETLELSKSSTEK